MSDEPNIKILDNGPYRVSGATLGRIGYRRNDAGRPVAWEDRGEVEHQPAYALCRCGASSNKPFCDGTHKNIDWNGTETADRASSASRRKSYQGEDVVLTDDKELCVHAGFCVREDAKAWDVVYKATDPAQRELLEQMVHACPSGRLELHAIGDDAPIEPALAPRIDIVDDGPLYVQGEIPIEGSDGDGYEVRNRVTLCRCGASANKPYCDGSHSDAGFRDS